MVNWEYQYHGYTPLVEVNQAIIAWSLRQMQKCGQECKWWMWVSLHAMCTSLHTRCYMRHANVSYYFTSTWHAKAPNLATSHPPRPHSLYFENIYLTSKNDTTLPLRFSNLGINAHHCMINNSLTLKLLFTLRIITSQL